MSYFHSSYTFSIEGSTRTFHHRWRMAGRVYECDACGTTCDVRAAYSQHWSSVGRTHCSAEQRTQLKTIEEQRINNFILCNERNRSTNEFLLDAGIQAIPQLLRLLFHDAGRLHFRLSFYVRALNETDFLFCSSELAIEHHLDISETVDVLFLMLLEKIEAYMYACYPTRAAEYSVKRIKIYVRRELNRTESVSTTKAPMKCILPLQYRVKHATAAPSAQAVSASVAADANLYCFRICARTQELYVVPYQLGKCPSNACDSEVQRAQQTWDRIGCGAHYIQLESIDGAQQQLLEISNITRFLRTDEEDHVHTCVQCKANFTQRTKFQLHKALDCGRGFEVLQLDSDNLEIYEHCLQMRCDNYKWPLFGIIE
ncbi:PREDICTED: protein terminus [Bactrocera latifrons]|uniref:protein terminus n=1 Tax=Bactrocera latifrons TaxID=174628 RepID=UPI0008DE2A3F|nr:PREDICTED: protein terminus [Bactrocera latifrons]